MGRVWQAENAALDRVFLKSGLIRISLRMRQQLQQLGLSIDWSREVTTVLNYTSGRSGSSRFLKAG